MEEAEVLRAELGICGVHTQFLEIGHSLAMLSIKLRPFRKVVLCGYSLELKF